MLSAHAHNWPGRDCQHYRSISVQKRLQMLYITRQHAVCALESSSFFVFLKISLNLDFMTDVSSWHNIIILLYF